MALEKLGALAGLVLLLHAAYSTINYRAHLKLHELEFDQPPVEVLLEVLVGTLVCLWAGSQMAGELLPIKSEMSDENPEQLEFKPDFVNLYTRHKLSPLKESTFIKS